MGKITVEDQLEDFQKLSIQKKKKINSKSKGKTGEAYFVNILKDISSYPFFRTPNSGSFLGQENRRRVSQMTMGQIDVSLGDIICPSFLKNRLIFESKNYAEDTISFHNLMTKDIPKKIIEWQEQIEYDTETAYMIKDNKKIIPILCIKITRVGSFAVFNLKLMETFGTDILDNLNYVCFKKPITSQKLIDEGFLDRYYMIDFNEFINVVKNKLFEVNEEHPDFIEFFNRKN